METKKHNCPICSKELVFNARYLNYVCNECVHNATDKEGRKLGFSNTHLFGGFEAVYMDTREIYDSHICFINGIECYAEEARFGGIVVERK